MRKIILATTSPYRIKAFKFLGIDFEPQASSVDESLIERKDPENLVKALSKLKAKAVAKNYADAIIIGFDSVGYFNGQILEKPKSKEEAFKRLSSLSGNNHQFYTGIFMLDTKSGKEISKIVPTQVFMRKFSKEEIDKYLNEDQYFNTYALGYDPLEHSSSSFIERIEGSYNNITRDIPLEQIMEMLNDIGYKI
ncbi:MAG: Maf family protein [Candidatus Staskawiczbacteria bacterium]|jgi:septum formation protein